LFRPFISDNVVAVKTKSIYYLDIGIIYNTPTLSSLAHICYSSAAAVFQIVSVLALEEEEEEDRQLFGIVCCISGVICRTLIVSFLGSFPLPIKPVAKPAPS